MDCIFCKIAAGQAPCNKVYEDEHIIAFYDLAPAAPVHVLVIPKEHCASCAAEIDSENSGAVARVFEAIPVIAEKLNLKNGYRIVANVGADAGQTVPHLHFHILGGEKLGKMV